MPAEILRNFIWHPGQIPLPPSEVEVATRTVAVQQTFTGRRSYHGVLQGVKTIFDFWPKSCPGRFENRMLNILPLYSGLKSSICW